MKQKNSAYLIYYIERIYNSCNNDTQREDILEWGNKIFKRHNAELMYNDKFELIDLKRERILRQQRERDEMEMLDMREC